MFTTDAGGGAVGRLRAARERARGRRVGACRTMERLRQRNREESSALAGRGMPGRPAPGWPDRPRPPEPRRYGVDDPEWPRPRGAAPAARSQAVGGQLPEDDWPPESWLC